MSIFWRLISSVCFKLATQIVNKQIIVLKFYTLLGESFSKISEDLHAVQGDFCLSNYAILMWTNHFKACREATEDDKHAG